MAKYTYSISSECGGLRIEELRGQDPNRVVIPVFVEGSVWGFLHQRHDTLEATVLGRALKAFSQQEGGVLISQIVDQARRGRAFTVSVDEDQFPAPGVSPRVSHLASPRYCASSFQGGGL
jgi:hypothetical protein